MEKIHVLLVEDEQTLAMIIKDTLEEQDFIITTAGDGEEGLRKFFEQKPDVLVADVMMPRMVSIRPRACFSPSYNKVKSQTKHVWLLTLL